MNFEDILELKNGELNGLTAANIMKYEPLSVGYFGTDSETPRQTELALWMEKIELQNVGEFYISVCDDFYTWKDSWKPSENFEDAWQVFQTMRSKLFSKRQKFMSYLKLIIKEEVGADVAWPDAFWFVKPETICRAALCVEFLN